LSRLAAFVFFFLFSGKAVLAQADFSADIVNLSAANTFPTKIFATKDKLRFQGQDRNGRTTSVMLVDLAAGTSIVLIPQQHQYVQQTRAQIPGQGVTFFQPKDVDNACTEWQKMALTGREKCHKMGHETFNGRDTVKYESTPARGDGNAVWVDVKLHFPVKWKGPALERELRNIVERPQGKELFEVPAGYTKRTFEGPVTTTPSQP
jgi:hypothetical protein